MRVFRPCVPAFIALVLFFPATTTFVIAANVDPKGFTVTSGIETRRVLYQLDNGGNAVTLSPDGRRYLVVLVRGDLQRDGNWIELVSGHTDSLDAAIQTPKVTRLFTRSYALNPLRYNPVMWLSDSRRIAFLWSDGAAPYQVVSLDLETSKLAELTHHATDVTAFSMSSGGDAISFVAKVPYPNASERFREMIREGFAVSEATYTIVSLLNGYPDDASQGWYDRELFVRTNSDAQPRRVLELSTPQQMAPATSPNGRWTAFLAPAADIPSQWDDYDDEAVQREVAEARTQRRLHSLRTDASPLRQLRLIDTRDGSVTSLLDAPSWVFSSIKWSPDSLSLLVGPTCVRVATSRSCTLFVEIGVSDGQVRILPLPQRVLRAPLSIEWTESDHIVFRSSETGSAALSLKRRAGHWANVSSVPQDRPAKRGLPVTIQLRQDPNHPPELVAVDASGNEHAIFDVNPALRETFELGSVEIVHWRDREGVAWSGRLYSPARYRSGEQVPLVILTVPRIAALPSQFSLSGVEVVVSSVGIAQPLAGKGIAVLTMGQPDDPAKAQGGTPREPQIVLNGYESAVDNLVARGLVDPNRVGLVGYSRSGYYVQYAITHSNFNFAAAVAADNVDQSYVQSTLVGNEMTWPEAQRMNGAAPFGDGLKLWLERAPGFNADKVRTPFRMELNSGGLANIVTQWELFSQLRRLRKPVELYVIPEIGRGEHGLENPTQQLASLQGAVDWLDFWLNSKEDPDVSKQQQYVRWRQLRKLRAEMRTADGS